MKNAKTKQDGPGEEFFQRFRQGDESAFTDLVELYEDELFFFINGMVHDIHESKHIMIDAFASLALDGGKFAGRSSVKTYLFTIAKNLALKHMKMRKKDQHIAFETIVGVVPDYSGEPEKMFVDTENRRLVHEAMMELKEEYRVVLVLLYFEDMSHMEVGRVLNKNVNQINVLAYRAKAALKKQLQSRQF